MIPCTSSVGDVSNTSSTTAHPPVKEVARRIKVAEAAITIGAKGVMVALMANPAMSGNYHVEQLHKCKRQRDTLQHRRDVLQQERDNLVQLVELPTTADIPRHVQIMALCAAEIKIRAFTYYIDILDGDIALHRQQADALYAKRS